MVDWMVESMVEIAAEKTVEMMVVWTATSLVESMDLKMVDQKAVMMAEMMAYWMV